MGETDRKKLIFFASADPRQNPGPAWSAYHFANVASNAGLDAEVRLAGDAVRVAHPDEITEEARGGELREKVRAGVDAPYLISL
jgi:hypothetical protein